MLECPDCGTVLVKSGAKGFWICQSCMHIGKDDKKRREARATRHLDIEIKRLNKLGIHLKPEYVSSHFENKNRHDFFYEGKIFIWKKRTPTDADKREAEKQHPLKFGSEEVES